jgi:HD-GYP domain-containing protein (c-di-GMP phosphodiesterase class II)
MDYKKLYLDLKDRVKQLNKIGLALSTEKNTDKLFEMILDESTKISNAAGSTLYQSLDNKLIFSIIKNEPLNIWQGGISGNDINFPPIDLYLENREKNFLNVCAFSAITGNAVNINDAYQIKHFDFSGMKKFDKQTGFKSQSILTVPMKDHENEIIGVIQLFNARDEFGKVIPFSDEVRDEIESLASQGAISLSNKKLVEDLQEIFESFIKLIALAIDRKSEYTGGHCQRVPELTMMLAEALEKQTTGKFKDFKMTNDEKYELKIAAWLHDCGKVATPVHVVDKSTKLETIFDRIELIKTRFQAVKDQRKIEFLSSKISLLENGKISGLNKITEIYNLDINELNSDLELIIKFNLGAEFMPVEIQNKIKDIGKKAWIENGIKKSLLTQNEIENLIISKGTLNLDEREEINNHIVVTLEMLNNLPYPKHLKKVPEFAGGHHEKIDGTGYPMGLSGDEMSIQAKVMAVADIYEALTAKDRPYKKGKKLSESMRILGFMKNDYHIDKDIFEIFVKEKVYKKYADLYVAEEQHDNVNELELIN